MGVCASSGGMFNNYAVVQGVDHIMPVDMYLPGCPPRPEMLIDAILKLHHKIQNEPLGPEARREARRPEGRAGAVEPEVRQGGTASTGRLVTAPEDREAELADGAGRPADRASTDRACSA